MYDISRIAYELYKQNWVDTHTTREMRLDNIMNWGKIEIEDDSPDSPDTYEAYREEFGYESSLYVCYNEFCCTEYQDIEFMQKLLQSESLIKKYLEDEENLLGMKRR